MQPFQAKFVLTGTPNSSTGNGILAEADELNFEDADEASDDSDDADADDAEVDDESDNIDDPVPVSINSPSRASPRIVEGSAATSAVHEKPIGSEEGFARRMMKPVAAERLTA